MRAVADPNVLISALLSREGSPAQVLLAWREGRFDLIVSPLLLEELERALAYPKLRRHVTEGDATAVVGWLSRSAATADDPTGQPAVTSSDSGDDYLIALAGAERAALVSGDKHLLALAGRIPVYSPREFLELLDRG